MQRKLGYTESSFIFRKRASLGANLAAVISLAGFIDSQLFSKALYKIFLKHPLLQGIVLEKDHQLHFDQTADFNNIELRTIHRQRVDHWKEVLSEYVNEPINSSVSLWKLILLEDSKIGENEIILIAHRAIMDNLSPSIFFRDLLNIYTMLESGSSFELKNLSVLPPIEKLVQEYKSENQYRLEKPKIVADYWNFLETAPLGLRKSKQLYLTLSTEQLNDLRKRAVSNQVSLHSILEALAAITTVNFLQKKISIVIHSETNLRPYTDQLQENQNIGCFTTGTKTSYTIQHEHIKFWEFAKIIERTKNDHAYFPPTNFQQDNLEKKYSLKAQECDQSNRGKIAVFASHAGDLGDFSIYGKLRMNFFYFAPELLDNSQLFAVTSAIFSQKLFCCFSSTYPLLDSANFLKIENIFYSVLEKITAFEREKRRL